MTYLKTEKKIRIAQRRLHNSLAAGMEAREKKQMCISQSIKGYRQLKI
jgi:hypothetical protein